jgi:hypothetical protein
MRETIPEVEQDDTVTPEPLATPTGVRASTRALHRQDVYDPISGVTITIWSAAGVAGLSMPGPKRWLN